MLAVNNQKMRQEVAGKIQKVADEYESKNADRPGFGVTSFKNLLT